MSIENKLKKLFFTGLVVLIMNCSNNKGISSEVINKIEEKINSGMKIEGYGYLAYASGRIDDKKGKTTVGTRLVQAGV